MSNLKAAPSRNDFRKHVATVHVSGELSLLERKIVNVLLLNAYDDLLTRKTHSLPIGVLSTMLAFDSKNTGALKLALRKIMSTPLTFDLLSDDGNAEWHATPLIAYAGVKDGICSYEYSDWLARKLAEPESYTLININVQKQFSGSYALALYENCLRFRGTGSTGWISVDTWRKLLGADASMYDQFKHFSSEVIKKAVAEVNKVSNIVITPEYEREARRVVRIRFLIKSNPANSEASENPEIDEIRRSETYKGLLSNGIGDRLAVSWIQQDPERAAKTVAYTEQKLKNKKISTSRGGYARKVFENGNEIVVADDAPSAPGPVSLPAPIAQASKAKATTAAIKALSQEDKREFAESYISEGGAGLSYRSESGEFKDPIERMAFTNWLRQTIASKA